MKLKTLALIAVIGTLSVSNAIAAPDQINPNDDQTTMDMNSMEANNNIGGDGNDMLADNDTNSITNDFNNTNSNQAEATDNSNNNATTNDEMSPDTATGDDDY